MGTIIRGDKRKIFCPPQQHGAKGVISELNLSLRTCLVLVGLVLCWAVVLVGSEAGDSDLVHRNVRRARPSITAFSE
jgi:hypothetical protein